MGDEPGSKRDELTRVSWFRRPRRRLRDSVPSSKIVATLWMFPYICSGLIIEWLLGGPKPAQLPVLAAFALVALGETIFLILWLRRPVKGRAAR